MASAEKQFVDKCFKEKQIMTIMAENVRNVGSIRKLLQKNCYTNILYIIFSIGFIFATIIAFIMSPINVLAYLGILVIISLVKSITFSWV